MVVEIKYLSDNDIQLSIQPRKSLIGNKVKTHNGIILNVNYKLKSI